MTERRQYYFQILFSEEYARARARHGVLLAIGVLGGLRRTRSRRQSGYPIGGSSSGRRLRSDCPLNGSNGRDLDLPLILTANRGTWSNEPQTTP
jgi:hypothetical protein